MKLSRRYATKGEALKLMFCRKLQARTVAIGQKFCFLCGWVPSGGDNGSYGVKDIAAGKVEGRRDFCFAGGFLMALLFHKTIANISKLHSRRRMDGIVNAGVAWYKTTKEGAVGGIDDAVCGQAGNIALPENYLIDRNFLSYDVALCLRGNNGKIEKPDNALFRCFFLQQNVLLTQKILRNLSGRSHIHQRAQQPPLSRDGLGEGGGLFPVTGHFGQQNVVKKKQSFQACHIDSSIVKLSALPKGQALREYRP